MNHSMYSNINFSCERHFCTKLYNGFVLKILAHTIMLGFVNWVTCYGCNMCMGDLTDMYAQARRPQARGRVHTYQLNQECT